MNNLAITYQHIADILSFESSNSKLEHTLSDPTFNWEAIVKEGSLHYVIPAIYCRLRSRQLLHVLPKDLISYLDYITDENRQRNTIILAQINELTDLLNSHNIEHTFLKGAALLASGTYKDIAERMLGDIDILVHPEQLTTAFELLRDDGYQPKAMTLGHHFFEHKHLPRLETKLTATRIAAVEVHRKLFVSYHYDALQPQSIFEETRQIASIYIPSQKHLLMHTILNHQINDEGALYNSITFRSAYDTILLLQDYTEPNTWSNQKVFKKYFKYTSLFFNEIRKTKNVKPDIFSYFYLFKLKHIKFYRIWNKLLRLGAIIPILLHRSWLFISNKAYRKAIILDKNRIFTHFMSILRKN
ncbi:nucleotidyltransferase family protein [Winogradskyella sp. SM1960]|uniref:nucleotidyltransferase family protein n=1 Tax=Winogradskyella sp. SM1960 TaxID=2865955 RepID=UPI001CD63B67|nr:nucleotidyltransferase family protein [Winogradskyella sp. SM1960]